jgi:chromosome partitioning protein
MRVLTFVTQKGGVGKSTLAACIAVAAAEAGETVCILDGDPLGALRRWGQLRPVEDIGIAPVDEITLASTLAALEEQGATLAVIDTPGADSALCEAAIRAADLCIIPARPNAFDLWATEGTRKKAKSLGRSYAFLLNQCPPTQQSARVEQGVQALQAMGGLIGPLLSARVDYQEAARSGLGVTEIRPRGIAAEEIRGLWQAIDHQVKPRSNVRRYERRKAVASEDQQDAASGGSSLLWWMGA